MYGNVICEKVNEFFMLGILRETVFLAIRDSRKPENVLVIQKPCEEYWKQNKNSVSFYIKFIPIFIRISWTLLKFLSFVHSDKQGAWSRSSVLHSIFFLKK